MKNVFFFLALLCISATAQKRDTIFTDLNGKVISRSAFYGNRDKTYAPGYSAYGAEIKAQMVERQNFHEISQSAVKELRLELEKLSGQKIDSTKIVVLEYIKDYASCYGKFSGDYNPIRRQRQVKNYKSLLKKNNDITYFFVTKNPKSKYHSEKIITVVDSNSYVGDKFFPIASFRCPSLLIVHPIGAYFIHRGEHPHELINEVLTIFRNNTSAGK